MLEMQRDNRVLKYQRYMRSINKCSVCKQELQEGEEVEKSEIVVIRYKPSFRREVTNNHVKIYTHTKCKGE